MEICKFLQIFEPLASGLESCKTFILVNICCRIGPKTGLSIIWYPRGWDTLLHQPRAAQTHRSRLDVDRQVKVKAIMSMKERPFLSWSRQDGVKWKVHATHVVDMRSRGSQALFDADEGAALLARDDLRGLFEAPLLPWKQKRILVGAHEQCSWWRIQQRAWIQVRAASGSDKTWVQDEFVCCCVCTVRRTSLYRKWDHLLRNEFSHPRFFRFIKMKLTCLLVVALVVVATSAFPQKDGAIFSNEAIRQAQNTFLIPKDAQIQKVNNLNK